MNDFYNTNLIAIKQLFNIVNVQPYSAALEILNEPLTPYLLGENEGLWLVGKKYFYHILPHTKKAEQWLKNEITATEFINAAPHGKVIVFFKNHVRLNIDGIKVGRLADFLQSIFPQAINQANYDNTVRGQNPKLLDPSHAEEIDKLRRYMQEGKISQYEFDDYNPAYPKAGK